MFDSETASSSFVSSFTSLTPPARGEAIAVRFAEASDEDLARALLAGGADAQRATWQRFHPIVTRMVRRVFGRNGDADEVVQEVFLCLFRRVHTLRAPAAFRAFVIAITKRTMSHEQRRRRERFYKAPEWEENAAEAMRVTADPTSKHALISLEHLVARLRRRERNAFMLRFVEGMDAAEVGAQLGVSIPTARRTFSRAWKRVNVWASRDPFLSDYLRGAVTAEC